MAKKKGRRPTVEGELSITSMMDMMTIILVFLLKSYSTEDISVKASDDLEIPLSSAKKPPRLAVNLVVTRSQVLVDSVPVLSLERVPDEETGEEIVRVPEDEKKGQMVSKLYDRLLEKAEYAEELSQRAGTEDSEFKGQILLQCDRRLPFNVIREVMYTAGQAKFGEFKFVVIQGGEG
ncbi:MAG: biopolymer transporter ExbD [Proteobacteria bacterium]|nr:biopolymer transporter ExbD [Pseudomonadota bacterium]